MCTRPSDRNGFGLSIEETNRRAELIENQFTLLPDNDQIHREWRRMVRAESVSGVQVHDLRLVAAMIVHGVTHLLTLNDRDFARYSRIVATHPSTIRP